MEFLLPTPTLARGPAVEERGVGLRETYQRPEACSLQPPGLWEGAGPVQSPPAVPAAQRVHWLGLPSNVPPGGVTQCGALDCFCSARRLPLRPRRASNGQKALPRSVQASGRQRLPLCFLGTESFLCGAHAARSPSLSSEEAWEQPGRVCPRQKDFSSQRFLRHLC